MTTVGYLAVAGGFMDWKFTGQPRDKETGLDWFPARTMSGAEGRFQSVDPGNAGAIAGDPQSWNMYSYVGNNPLSFTDPSGEGIFGWIGGIIGSFFGPWGSTIGYAAGSGIDAVIGGPDADKGTFVGNSLAGTFGCGGWAGNCGGSSGPWSENSGLGPDVQNPGRFVDDLSAREVVGNSADFIAGAGDSISFGFSAWFRRKVAGKDPRNRCSGFYTAGGLTPLALGGARLAYAGTAKALPLLARGGATELETALAVSQARNTLKVIARAGMGGNFRLYTEEEILAKYGPDAATIMSKATQTNAGLNALGGGVVGGALGALAGRPGYCQ